MYRIAILTGGTNAEREVALKSAHNVREALSGRFEIEVFDFPTGLEAFVSRHRLFEVAVPVFHGRGGEDGVVQGFLRTLGVPFVFSDVAAHALAIDKEATKRLVSTHGIKTADWVVVVPGEKLVFDHPVVVKPLDNGSSVGVVLVRTADELDPALEDAFAHASRVLVERLIQGREFTVAVVNTQALPVIEIRSKKDFFDFESKYDPALCEELCPAPIDNELTSRLQEVALAAHCAIGARHLSRTDLIVDALGEIWFLEINTIPGLTEHSLTPKAIRAAGLTLGDLLDGWIQETIRKTA